LEKDSSERQREETDELDEEDPILTYLLEASSNYYKIIIKKK